MKIIHLLLLINSTQAIMRIPWNGFYQTSFTDHLKETTTTEKPTKPGLSQCIELIMKNSPQKDIYLCLLKLQRRRISNIDLTNLAEVTKHYKNLVKDTFEFLQRS